MTFATPRVRAPYVRPFTPCVDGNTAQRDAQRDSVVKTRATTLGCPYETRCCRGDAMGSPADSNSFSTQSKGASVCYRIKKDSHGVPDNCLFLGSNQKQGLVFAGGANARRINRLQVGRRAGVIQAIRRDVARRRGQPRARRYLCLPLAIIC